MFYNYCFIFLTLTAILCSGEVGQIKTVKKSGPINPILVGQIRSISVKWFPNPCSGLQGEKSLIFFTSSGHIVQMSETVVATLVEGNMYKKCLC